MTAPEPVAAVVDHEAGTITVAVTFRWDRQQLCLDKCEARAFTAAMRETLVSWLVESGWGPRVITGFSYACYEPDEEVQLGRIAHLSHPLCGGCGKPAVALDYSPWYGHADVNDTLSCRHFADDELSSTPLVTFPNLCDVELRSSTTTLKCDTCGDEPSGGGAAGEPCGRDMSEELDQPDGSTICNGIYRAIAS